MARLLVSQGTGRKPTKRTFGMLRLSFSGWASAGELLTQLAQLPKASQ